MSMSTHVVGFKPPDKKWQKMKDVWNACEAAGIRAPMEVQQFFGGTSPDDAGVEVDQTALESIKAVREWSDSERHGYEIDITKLPKDVTIVRFYNSW